MNKTVFSGIAILMIVFLSACRQKGSNTETQPLPSYHFTAGTGWTGEPAGLVYADGDYHLFYQHNPTDDKYGNIHWGHAISRDLLHWQIMPVALSPDSSGYLRSGSVIADTQNTSGLSTGKSIPFIAFYTYNDPAQEQEIACAYSTDKGATWTKLSSFTLSDCNGFALRNPHVSWNNEYQQWLMTVSIGPAIRFYTSPDCKQWTYRSEFKDMTASGNWEGSDFFPLKIEGEDTTKWVLLINMENGPAGGAPATRYFIGDFDGTSFRISQTKELWLDYGKDHYAFSTFNGLPDNQRIGMGWMNDWEYANLLPASGWCGNMTLPRRIKLVREGTHCVLANAPLEELEKYRKDSCPIESGKLSDEKRIKGNYPYPGKPVLLKLKFDNTDHRAIWRARNYGIRLKTKSGRELSIGYQNELSYYYIDRSNWTTQHPTYGFQQLMGATYYSEADTSDWSILFDRNSVELFASGGKIAMTALRYPMEEFCSYELFADSGSVTLLEGSINELKNINP